VASIAGSVNLLMQLAGIGRMNVEYHRCIVKGMQVGWNGLRLCSSKLESGRLDLLIK
jgi:hypothetical protein